MATERSRANRPGRSVVGSASSRGGGSSSKSLRASEARRASRRRADFDVFSRSLPGASAEVVEVDLALVGRLGQPLGELERLVDDRRAGAAILAHLVEDRPLRARGDDRVGHALDPDARAAAAASVGRVERLERVDLVGARVLPEAEEDHPGRAVRHQVIMQPAVGSRDAADLPVAPAPVRPRARVREGRGRLELGRAARAAGGRVRAGVGRTGRRAERARALQRHRGAASRAGRARHRPRRRGRLLVLHLLGERESRSSTRARRRCSWTRTRPPGRWTPRCSSRRSPSGRRSAR